MMNTKIAFARLQKFLLDLDFVEMSVPESHRWFEHTATGTKLVFRYYQSRDRVAEADLVSVRKMLDENGLLRPDQFEHWLRETAA